MSLQTPPMSTGEYSTLAEVAGAQAALNLSSQFIGQHVGLGVEGFAGFH